MTIFVSIRDGASTMQAFEHQGPYTDYPAWAKQLFTEGKLKYGQLAGGLYLQEGQCSSGYSSDNDLMPVRGGDWVTRTVQDGREEVLRTISVEELRAYWYPSQAEEDDSSNYASQVNSGFAQVELRPVRLWTFKWTGYAHEAPVWVLNLVQDTEGATIVDRVIRGLAGRDVLPGDWLVYEVGVTARLGVLNPAIAVRAFSDKEYKGHFPDEHKPLTDVGNRPRVAKAEPEVLDPLAGLSDQQVIDLMGQERLRAGCKPSEVAQ